MLKPNNVTNWIPQMEACTLDFIDLTTAHRDSNGEIPDYHSQIHKWALECKWVWRLVSSFAKTARNAHDRTDKQIWDETWPRGGGMTPGPISISLRTVSQSGTPKIDFQLVKSSHQIRLVVLNIQYNYVRFLHQQPHFRSSLARG